MASHWALPFPAVSMQKSGQKVKGSWTLDVFMSIEVRNPADLIYRWLGDCYKDAKADVQLIGDIPQWPRPKGRSFC